MKTEVAPDLQKLQSEYNTAFEKKNSAARNLVAAIKADDDAGIETSSTELKVAQGQENVLRDKQLFSIRLQVVVQKEISMVHVPVAVIRLVNAKATSTPC